MDKEQALIRARQEVENLSSQMMVALKNAQETQEQQQRVFQKALDKLHGELDAAKIENSCLANSIRPPRRSFLQRVVDVFIPDGCTIQ